MRIHRLEVEAFGPFAERVVLDLDDVSASGLFLVHGPTGSGKTSLLDAVCFGLYGDVPGARRKQGLRSDHAAPDAVPQVVVELTVARRRLRLTRSPEWQRPKKRGSGTVRQQASVFLEELVGGAWQPLSTGHPEVAEIVTDVLGMGLKQFASVVLLPQGEFATFLRAEPEERRLLLERLFDIGVFADVEEWLAEARRSGGTALESAEHRLVADLQRLEDALTEVPGLLPTDGEDPQHPPLVDTSVDALPTRLGEVAARLDELLTEALTEADGAELAEAAAQSALDDARALDALRTRGLAARARLESLDAQVDTHRARRAELDAADRAAQVTGQLRAADRAAADLETAREAVASARQGVTSLGPALQDDPAAALATLRGLDPAAEALSREAGTARRLAGALETEAARSASVRAAMSDVEAQLPDALAAVESAQAEAERVEGDAARVDALCATLAAARARRRTLDELDDDRAALEALAPGRAQAGEALLTAQSTLISLRSRRLDGMAAELARDLSSGEPCPVCGGAEHPAPAVAADAVDPEDVAAAEARLEAARAHRDALERDAAGLDAAVTARLATLDGATPADVDREVEEVTASHLAAQQAAASRAAVARRLTQARHETERLTTERARLASAASEADRRVQDLTAEAADTRERFEAAVTAHDDCPCGAPDPARHAAAAEALTALVRALEDENAAARRASVAAADLEAALTAGGFGAADEARAAVRGPADLDRLRDAVLTHDRARDAAGSILGEPEVAAALSAEPPALDDLGDDVRAARHLVLAARGSHDAVGRARRICETLRPALVEACTRIAGLAERQARVRELADAVCGTGGDNTLRMRLTSFVLAARLEKVAELANERLAVMGGGRYVLEHSDERAARGARSGLGLRVLDQWTGKVRDTASLSGGESFMASLALALGLADAVREESGGLDLGTLFIDEGFGSLDDDSLEQVLTVLDGLREGGRAVGVISHVADLRSRVPDQVVVSKGASGSSVTVRGAAEPAA
ncbi:SMC family ATPase [Phycicoccus sp. CSK15P-2]|uniref:AAA family ATPase n=1 Tax=Phycicoccus sp. CSK15P-2 TaxID=2807627 RepID=UPI001951ABCC|nr:SMC family ATPase [Phycicoccus sp. CSK15P-2]MBM6405763.1 SMC family ATPase [Phycicoccus sp. CSK15P-2]